MVIPSRQMAQYHQLDSSNKVNIKCDNENIERVKEYKLLGIILDEHFELHSYVKVCVRYFLSNFYFSPNDSPSKTMKNILYFI